MKKQRKNMLLKVFLIIVLLGIISLLILSKTTPKLRTVSELNEKMLEKKVTLQGELISIEKKAESFYIAEFKDKTGKIQVTLGKKIPISNNNIRIVGEVQEFNNNLQIKADRIEIIQKIS